MQVKVVIKRLTLQQIENMIKETSKMDSKFVNGSASNSKAIIKKKKTSKNVISKAKLKVIPKKPKPSKKLNARPQFIIPFKKRL